MTPHSIFGWSYPPGCSGPPTDDGAALSPQSEEVYCILEDVGCEQKVIDGVVKIVDDLADLAAHCPRCEKQRNEAELQLYKETAAMAAGRKND